MFSLKKKTLKKVIKRLKALLGENQIPVLAFGSRVKGDFNIDHIRHDDVKK